MKPMQDKKPVGLTKDVGWQMGIRKTLPVSLQEAWNFMFSDAGIKIWLGAGNKLVLEAGETYKTSSGTSGLVKVFKPLSHIRMTWQKKQWPNASTLQVRVMSAKNKAVISFHQEKLSGKDQREEMLTHWEDILGKIEKKLMQNRAGEDSPQKRKTQPTSQNTRTTKATKPARKASSPKTRKIAKPA